MRLLSAFFSFCLVFPATHAALAARSANLTEPAQGSSSSVMMTNLIGFAPIVIFLVILYALFRRQTNSPAAKLQRQNVERYQLHMQRVEELLERIAAQLERQGKL